MNGTQRDSASDAQLIRQVSAGARARYSLLVQRHEGPLFRYALGMMSDPRLAQALVEQTFVDAYAKLRECRPRDRFGLWVLRLLRRHCLAHLSKRSEPSRGPPSEVGGLAEGGGVGAPPRRRSSTLEEMSQLLSDPEEREAFLLKHVEDLGYEDIGEIVEVSPDVVRERVYRAREGLLITSG